MSNFKEIFVKTDNCTGCQNCRLACAVEHSQSKRLFAALGETVKPRPRVYVEWLPDNTKVPILCRHCEDAPCVHACISGAITRSDQGIVLTHTDKCIGCWTCVMVCPYGVIGRDPAISKAYRCDRCLSMGVVHTRDKAVETHIQSSASTFRKIVFNQAGTCLIGALFIGDITGAGMYRLLIREQQPVARFKTHLIRHDLHYGHFM